MHDMDMQMVVCRLVVQVEFQLVRFDGGVKGCCYGEEFMTHVREPGNVALAEVADGEEITAEGKNEEVQGGEGASVPVEVGENEERFVLVR